MEKIKALLHPVLAPGAHEVTFDDVDESMKEIGGGTHLADAKPKTVEDTKPFQEAKVDLGGVTQLKQDVNYLALKQTVTDIDLPMIREDMLMQTADLVQNYKSYVPSLYSDWPDREQGWLLVWRPGNDRGLRYTDHVIMTFFTWDEFFEDSWNAPDIWVSKLLNAGIKFSMAPDFSIWDDRPRAEQLWALYRQRWMGRYQQDAGVKLVPHFTWSDEDFLTQYVLPSVPTHVPVISGQMQKVDSYLKSPYKAKQFFYELELIYNHCTPEVYILYGVEAQEELILRAGLPWRVKRVEPFGNQMHLTKEARAEREILRAKGIT
jgi:hypothetical protein